MAKLLGQRGPRLGGAVQRSNGAVRTGDLGTPIAALAGVPPKNLGRSQQRPLFRQRIDRKRRHHQSPTVWKPVQFSGAGLRTSVPAQLPD